MMWSLLNIYLLGLIIVGNHFSSVQAIKDHVRIIMMENTKTFFGNPLPLRKSKTYSRRATIPTTLHNYYGGAVRILEISDLKEFEQLVNSKKDQLIVVDFTASWCGPCKFISPYFQELANSKEFRKVTFVKVDVDEGSEIAAKYQVNAMPTFLFLKNKKVIDRFSGASKDHLFQLLQKYN